MSLKLPQKWPAARDRALLATAADTVHTGHSYDQLAVCGQGPAWVSA